MPILSSAEADAHSLTKILHAEREAFLRGAVQNPESAARFEEFVLDGIQYMEQVGRDR